jgi:hypothetical protein
MGIQNIDERREYAYCIIAWLKCISAYVRTLRMTPTITHSLASHHHAPCVPPDVLSFPSSSFHTIRELEQHDELSVALLHTKAHERHLDEGASRHKHEHGKHKDGQPG